MQGVTLSLGCPLSDFVGERVGLLACAGAEHREALIRKDQLIRGKLDVQKKLTEDLKGEPAQLKLCLTSTPPTTCGALKP